METVNENPILTAYKMDGNRLKINDDSVSHHV